MEVSCTLAEMVDTREFKAKIGFAATASLGYGICILVSCGYLAGSKWANMWPLNILSEIVLLAVSTSMLLHSYERYLVASDGIVMRLPKGKRTIQWADLAVYEICGKNGSICKLRSFNGTNIRIKFSSFDL